MGVIHLAKNPATTPNSKHIDIRHHFIRERMANGKFMVVYVPSEEHSPRIFSLNRCTRGRLTCTEIL